MAICLGGHVTDSLKATHTALKAIPVLSTNASSSVLLSHVRYRYVMDRTAEQVRHSLADAHPNSQLAHGHGSTRRSLFCSQMFA